MKTNPLLLNEIAKGKWAMSLEGYGFWRTQVEKFLSGKKIDFAPASKSLIEYFDEDMTYLKPDREGIVNVPKGSTAIVNMLGPIFPYGNYWTYGADEIVECLRQLDANTNIKSILIYMDGPGGTVSAIAPFLEFGNTRNRKKKLGIVYETSCSAYLYIMYGLKPDFVWASNNISAVTGSIGVVLSYMDDTEWLKLNGLERVEIYSDESPDKNLAVRLALEGKYELIKEEMLNPLAKQFKSDAIRLRPQLQHEIPGVVTGKTYYSADAIKYGFADRVGSLAEAIQHLQVLSEIDSL